MSEAKMGHNSELTDAEREALFKNHFTTIKAQKAIVDREMSNLRNLYKKAKGDGITKKEVELAFEILNDTDNKLLERRRREAEIARWYGHPVGTQSDLFADPEPDRRPAEEKAYNAGRDAGMMGITARVPPEFSNGLGQQWLSGHKDGQETLMRANSLTNGAFTDEKVVPIAEAGKRRGGRPKGSKNKPKDTAQATPAGDQDPSSDERPEA